MKTELLTTEQYRSPYHYSAEENILKLVRLEENLLETVVDVGGRAGEPIPRPCEITF